MNQNKQTIKLKALPKKGVCWGWGGPIALKPPSALKTTDLIKLWGTVRRFDCILYPKNPGAVRKNEEDRGKNRIKNVNINV